MATQRQLQARVTELEKALALAIAQRDALNVQLAAEKSKTASLESQLAAKSEQLLAAQSKIAELEKEIERLSKPVIVIPNPVEEQVVAQTISPTTVNINDATSGVIQIIQVGGGIPNSYSNPQLGGTDAGLFSVAMHTDATHVALTLTSPQSADTYEITLTVDNDAGTSAAFDIDVIVAETAGSGDRLSLSALQALFATPPLPGWPVVTIARVGSSWVVQTSGVGPIGEGASFSTIGAAHSACQTAAPAGAVVQALTAGAYTESIYFSQNTGAVLGPVDGNLKPTICLMPVTSGVVIGVSNPNQNARMYLKNFLIGPSDAEIATTPTIQRGSAGIQFSNMGHINLINVKVRHIKGNGIEGQIPNEWNTRRYGRLNMYACEAWNCGNINTEHLLYCHCVTVGLFDCYFHDTCSGGHAVKTDCERLVMLGNTFVQNTGLRFGSLSDASAAVNISHACDVYADYNIAWNNLDDGGSAIQLISRTNFQGGASLKTPTIGRGMREKTSDARDLPWRGGGKGGQNRNGRVTSLSGGTLNIDRIHPEGENGINITLSTSTQYTVRLWTRDSANDANNYVQDFHNKMPTVVSSSKATFTGITTTHPYIVEHCAIKLESAQWDVVKMNSEYFNDDDPNFWWRLICMPGSRSELNLEAQNLYNFAYSDTNLIIINSSIKQNGINIEDKHQHLTWANNINGFELPLAPANNSEGPTAEWPDKVGYAEWKEPLQGPNDVGKMLARGKHPAGFVDQTNPGSIAYSVWPWLTCVADTHIFFEDNTTGTRYVGMDRGSSSKWLPDVRELVAGALVKVTSNSFAVNRAQSRLSGAHGATNVITVTDPSGAAPGKLCMLALPYQTWTPTGVAGMHRAMVIGVAGNAVTLDEPLPRAALDQAPIIFADPSGDRPATWQRIETLAPWV